ncbi:hypothetical protein E6W26_29105 [Pseudomonas aeruginosa]|uniref:hypothetical protein n=1 Tax=Pseudomonas aeruginosa TaxID=287 RepID=UPI00109DB66B|nr:hypothetical protein [Pseudomonas aeruginosa]EKV1241266.1 hypothetical protein [Pseudomonas aeruginosa]EKV8586175.1 hypothetical protein [Pseudomonas aeruginosa]ELN5407393.1 hypothetical protein [Pseudomonas aeruginosa]ELP1438584.1 hypothetical protein [Pseudomonas aeruginosa]THB16458.1 hypothetical protein E6W26_29105 [Pseudomonas aeruginosa]
MKDVLGFVIFCGTVIAVTLGIAYNVPKYWAGVVLFIGFGYLIFHHAIHNFFMDEREFEYRFSWILIFASSLTAMAMNSWYVGFGGLALVGIMFWTGGFIALHRVLASMFKALFGSVFGLFAKH